MAKINLEKFVGRYPDDIDLIYLKEQRRGLRVPQKSAFIEDVIKKYHYGKKEERQTWLDRMDRKGTIKIKKCSTKNIPAHRSLHSINSIGYSKDGKELVVGYRVGALQVRDADTGDMICNVRGPTQYKFPIMCIRFHPKHPNNFFASGACGNIFYCATSSGEYMKFQEEKNNEINSIDINNTATTLVSGGKDAILRLYDTETKQLKRKFARPDNIFVDEDNVVAHYHRQKIFTVKFHPQMADIFLSGGWDDVIKIWDIRAADPCMRTIRGPHICGEGIDIRDKVVLTGAWAAVDSLQTWDLDSATLIETINPINRVETIEGQFLYSVRFLGADPLGDTIIVGGSGTGTVEIISLKDKKIICYYDVQKTTQAIDSHNNKIAFGGLDNIIRLVTYPGDLQESTHSLEHIPIHHAVCDTW